jgi:hypothetical protein
MPCSSADPVEDVAAEDGLDLGVSAPVPGQVGEGHAVVGQHRVQAVGEGGHDLAQEGGAVRLGVGVVEGDVGELRDAVDGQEHEEPALGQAQLAGVDVDVADPGLGEASALGGSLVASRQAGDAVPPQAAVQGTAGKPGIVSRRQPRTSSSRRRVRRLNSTTTASSASVSTELRGRLGPIRASAVEVRRRHLATVFGFSP